MKKKTHTFTLYLLKNGIPEKNFLVENISFAIEEEIKLNGVTVGKLFVKPPIKNKPKWTNLFDEADKNPLSNVFTSSVSALYLLNASNRWFALTFGSGRFMLDENAIEERFGLLVCLNSISGKSIRTIDKQAMNSMGMHTREQANINAEIDEFTIDPEQDLLRAITGKPNVEYLGSRLSGYDALNTAVKTTMSSLPELCNEYLYKYCDDSYKKEFDWVDNISIVKNNSICSELDALLQEKIVKNDIDKTWMAIPEILDWTLVGGFSYSPKDPKLYSDILITDFLSTIMDPDEFSMDKLKRRSIFCRNADGDGIYKQWNAYKCIYCEVGFQNGTYLLTNGKWYKIETNFIENVECFINDIPESQIMLPDCIDMHEGVYNKQVAENEPNKYMLFDSQNIQYGGGRSKIEFCDLYTANRELIHVKKYGGSNVLSHLFSQGAVSAEIFLTDIEFRKLIDSKLPPHYKLNSHLIDFDAREFKVVYCVISKKGLELDLPFFSKISLRHAVRRLNAFGYKVEIKKINYIETT